MPQHHKRRGAYTASTPACHISARKRGNPAFPPVARAKPHPCGTIYVIMEEATYTPWVPQSSAGATLFRADACDASALAAKDFAVPALLPWKPGACFPCRDALKCIPEKGATTRQAPTARGKRSQVDPRVRIQPRVLPRNVAAAASGLALRAPTAGSIRKGLRFLLHHGFNSRRHIGRAVNATRPARSGKEEQSA